MGKLLKFIENKRLINAYWIPGRRYTYNDYKDIHHNKIIRIISITFDLIFLILSSIILSLFLIIFLSFIAPICRLIFRKRIKDDESFNNYLEGYYYSPAPCIFKFLEGKFFQKFSQNEMDLEIGIDNGQTSMLHFSGNNFKMGTEYSLLWGKDDIPKDKDIWRHKIVCDMRQLPVKSDSCRTIASVHVIDHIDGYEEAMTEIARVLKPGGSIILSTISKNYLFLNFKSIFWLLMSNREKAREIGRKKAIKRKDYNFYTETEWRNNLTKYGLKIIEFRTFLNGPIKYLYYFLIQSPLKKNGFIPFQYWFTLKLPGHNILKSYWKWVNYSIIYPACVLKENSNDGPHIFMKIVKE